MYERWDGGDFLGVGLHVERDSDGGTKVARGGGVCWHEAARFPEALVLCIG